MKEVKTYELQLTEDQKDKLEKLLDVIDVDTSTIKEVNRSSIYVEDEFPKQGDKYYLINSYGEILQDFKMDIDIDSIDNKRKDIGNIFKTRGDAKFVVERLKVIAEMKKFADMDLTEWGEHEHFYIVYNNKTNRLDICRTHNYTFIHSEIYFDSEETVQKCIDEVGKDRIKRYYIGIMW